MKGQQQVLSILLITLVLVAIVGSVYFWGLPLIQKNRDITLLKKAEDFMMNLNNKIKYVANTQSRDSIKVSVGTLTFDPLNNTLKLEVDTKGTIYATGIPVYFVRNTNSTGVWGRDEPEILYVKSIDMGGSYHNIYVLRYRDLVVPGTVGILNTYKIELCSDINGTQTIGKGHTILINYKGYVQNSTKITTKVGLSFE